MMKRLFCFALFTIFVLGCGDLDVALSSGKIYRVNALVDGLSLDECAVLSKNSKIAPYFDFNIKDDPDIDSLVVYIKNYMGKETFRVQYKFSGRGESWENDEVSAGTVAAEEASGKGGDDGTVYGGTQASGGLSVENSDGQTEDGAASADDTSAATKSGTLSAEDSGAKNIVLPSYNVLETGIVISVKDTDDDLPALVFGDDLQFGFNTMVFEVIASNQMILNHIEKPFFYLADKKFVINEIVNYIPGISSAARIVPPGEKIMLETRLSVDDSIDPYIIWYNGKHKISEGFVSEGENRILWSAPTQTGFQNIRAEVFPFDPNKQAVFIPAISHSVSLPVSERHGNAGYYTDIDTKLNRWYRLWGNLYDYKDPANINSALVKTDDLAPRWSPVSGTYGLVVGADDVYELPEPFFRQIRFNEGSGEALFIFSPKDGEVANGTLFQAEIGGKYADNDSEGVCVIQLSVYGNDIVLEALSNKSETVQARVPLIVDGNVFVSVAVDFQFFEKAVTVSIGVEDMKTGVIEKWEGLTVDFMPNGEGSIQFGGLFEKAGEEELPDAHAEWIINEIATCYNEVSPVLEAAVVEETLNSASETPAAEKSPDGQ